MQSVIVMGVSGSGKSTIGKALADALGCEFIEGDDFHSAANKAKMHSGHALTDADRAPWLHALREVIAGRLAAGRRFVLACSALKDAYRRELTVDAARVKFVYLTGAAKVLADRLAHRGSHFMSPVLLQSQLDTLEVPHDAITIDVTHASVNENVSQLVSRLR